MTCRFVVPTKYALVSALSAVIVATPAMATKSEWALIVKELGHAQTPAGISVLERMHDCGIRIQRDTSWAEVATNDTPTVKAKKGDVIVQIVFDAPPLPDDSPGVYKSLNAIWVASGGTITPRNGWAEQLQNKPPPIGSASWMNC